MFKVPAEKYERYRFLFDNEDFPCTWIESAFEYKSARLLVDEEKNPAVAILHYPYKAFIAGDSIVSEWAETLATIPEETEIYVDEKTWLPKLMEHFKGRLIQKTRIKMSHRDLSLEKLDSLKAPYLKATA